MKLSSGIIIIFFLAFFSCLESEKKESLRKANILHCIDNIYNVSISSYALLSFDEGDFWNKKFIYVKKNDTIDIVNIGGKEIVLSFIKSVGKYRFASDTLKVECSYNSIKEYELIDTNTLTYRGYIYVFKNDTIYGDSIYGMSLSR